MKTILITGASSGFGKAAAELLTLDKHKLVLIARTESALHELQKLDPANIYVAKVDVSNRKAVADFFSKVPQEFKDIDVVVNNAGLAVGLETADNADLDDWEQMVDTNIKGLLYVTRNCLEIFKKKNRGMVINIGSVAAHLPYRGGNVYGATKAFVKQFSRNLRTDLFGTDIRVTNIEPGMAETNFSVIRFKGDKEKAKQVYENARALTADDIARTIKWVIDQPVNVNIDNIEIMPIDQTFGGAVINRSPLS